MSGTLLLVLIALLALIALLLLDGGGGGTVAAGRRSTGGWRIASYATLSALSALVSLKINQIQQKYTLIRFKST